MTKMMLTDRPLHPRAEGIAEMYKAGKMNRREYFATMAALGVTAAGTYLLGGIAQEARAESQAKSGGTLRISMEVKEIKDPRTFDWSEMANVSRQSLEYLVRWNDKYEFEPWLLSGWETNDDATEIKLMLREGVTWANGDTFTSADLMHCFNLWCDKTVEGNSVASRLASLIDPETEKLRDGAVEVLDDYTIVVRPASSDITIIPGLADYPAAVVHRSYDPAGDLLAQFNNGTGPFEITEWQPGVGAKARKRDWWGTDVFGGPYLDEIEWIDHGTDPSAMIAALESEEVDCNHQTLADTVEQLDAIGLEKSEITTGATIVCRCNVNNPPYDDVRVRQALQAAVDNEVVLFLGYNGLGQKADNYHVGPMHEEWFELPAHERDVEKAQALLAEAGQSDYVHNLVSIDDDWRRNTTDAIASQLKDAGINVEREVIPGSTFWNNWSKYPFSTTNWNARPLGVQVLALAYRSGEAWNESGFASPEFDEALNAALGMPDVETRRAQMETVQSILRDSGIIIQPYWRSVYRHALATVMDFPPQQTFEHHLDKVWLDA